MMTVVHLSPRLAAAPGSVPGSGTAPSLAALIAIQVRVDGWRRQLAEAAWTPGYPFRVTPALRVLERTHRRLETMIRVHRALS